MAWQDFSTSYFVTPDFCSFWRLTCNITCELFGDSFYESGVMETFSSLNVPDRSFGLYRAGNPMTTH